MAGRSVSRITSYGRAFSALEVDRKLAAACLGLAAAWFMLNHAGIVGGWLYCPPGFEPFFASRYGDVAQYLTWAKAYESAWFIPNYHAPWITDPALFNPVLLLISRASNLSGVAIQGSLLVAHFFAYLLCGYGLFRCIRTFAVSRRERALALVVMLCSVPLPSLLAPLALLAGFQQTPGIGSFLYLSTDSFLHALPGSLLSTVGTGTTLLCLGFVGDYLQSRRRRYCLLAAAVAFASAILHPFEIVLIVTVTSVVLLAARDLRAAGVMAVAGAAGILPYAATAARVSWIRDAAAQNVFHPGNPLLLLASLGLPTVIALALVARRPTVIDRQDLLLGTWVLAPLVLVYVPGLPWTQHLFDGYHCAVGMFVARRLGGRYETVSPSVGLRRRAVHAIVGGVGALSLCTYPVYWYKTFQSGSAVEPTQLVNTIVSQDERALLEWFSENAGADELVMAPSSLAPWMATVPMHSFGSHYIFSIDASDQEQFARSFYAGQLDPGQASSVLREYGARYVVMPSTTRTDLPGFSERTTIGSWRVLENPNNQMKPYATR